MGKILFFDLKKKPPTDVFVTYGVLFSTGPSIRPNKKLGRVLPEMKKILRGGVCSSGYSWSLYKENSRVAEEGARGNSQGREQMHAILDKLGRSLRQKNYYNFMHYMKTFFSIRNLMIMKKL